MSHRDRAAAGIRALLRWYVPETGLWKTTGWWNSANALTAVIRYIRYTGDWSCLWVVENTFVAAQRKHPDFVNTFFDDNAWWALAWIDAYDLTGYSRYLGAARTIFARELEGWDSACGGGLWWNEKRTYKNAITNELFLVLAGLLHQRTPGDQDYRSWATRSWEWLRASGMIGPSGLVNDGLTASCTNNGGTTWTYNQGVILGGLAASYQITGDQAYLRRGEAIADAALDRLADARGILAEPCGPSGCDGDQTQFKGIFVRYLHEFLRASSADGVSSAEGVSSADGVSSVDGVRSADGMRGKPEYRAFILANADSVWDNARNAADQFGSRWGGPFDSADASRQSSALEVLTAAAALCEPRAGA
jgi:predicted alpha-1,6-mannanase (GH76 family)